MLYRQNHTPRWQIGPWCLPHSQQSVQSFRSPAYRPTSWSGPESIYNELKQNSKAKARYLVGIPLLTNTPMAPTVHSTPSLHQRQFIISVDDDDDDDGGGAPSPSALPGDPDVVFVCVAKPVCAVSDYSDIEIVHQRRAKDKKSLSSIDPVVLADDVAIVGECNKVQASSFYSHFRHLCDLPQPCPKCFCFACDAPVDQCPTWHEHKLAVDNFYWQSLREQFLRMRASAAKALAKQSDRPVRTFGCNQTNLPHVTSSDQGGAVSRGICESARP